MANTRHEILMIETSDTVIYVALKCDFDLFSPSNNAYFISHFHRGLEIGSSI